MKPPFPYYGGKQMLADRIINLLSPHDCYVEPYAGSLSVLLAKPRVKPRRWRMSDRPHVRFDPAQRFGYPAVKGINVDALAGMVWIGEPVDEVAVDYDVDRADVLVACWYLGLHGGKKWRKRWRDWALKAHEQMWHARTCDYTSIPDPPDRDELRRGAT